MNIFDSETRVPVLVLELVLQLDFWGMWWVGDLLLLEHDIY